MDIFFIGTKKEITDFQWIRYRWQSFGRCGGCRGGLYGKMPEPASRCWPKLTHQLMYSQGHLLVSRSELKYPQVSKKSKKEDLTTLTSTLPSLILASEHFHYRCYRTVQKNHGKRNHYVKARRVHQTQAKRKPLKYGFHSISESTSHQTPPAIFITSTLYKTIFPKWTLFTCCYCIDLYYSYSLFVIHRDNKTPTLFFSVTQNFSTDSKIRSVLH